MCTNCICHLKPLKINSILRKLFKCKQIFNTAYVVILNHVYKCFKQTKESLHCSLQTETMNNTSINTLAWSRNKLQEDSSNQREPHVILQTLFSIIAALAFCGNGLLCFVILQRRRFLRSSYNLLIFSLAVTDMLTGKYY